MGDTPLAALSAFARAVMEEGLPDSVATAMGQRLVDTVGVGVAAVQNENSKPVGRVVSSYLKGTEATVFGSREKVSVMGAAFVNGSLTHALDFDDTHLPSILHPSAVVVPAALAVGELSDATGERLLRAAAVGNEITCRLGLASYDPASRNSIPFSNGLHATSICGTLGAAAASSLILDLREDQVAHAIAIAASFAAGILEANRTGGTVKGIHCGWAAKAGIMAAALASEGLTGPPTALEGRFGFFRAFSEGRWDEPALTEGLGDRWEVAQICTKPFPANHFTHPGIEAARRLRMRGVQPADVVDIELGVAEPTLRTIAEPRTLKARPITGYQAKFSGPMTVALALLDGGGLGLAEVDFSRTRIRTPEAERLARLVRCYRDDEATAAFPYELLGILRLTLKGGEVIEERVSTTRGGSHNPLSHSEMSAKFRMNCHSVLGSRAENLQQALENVSEVRSVRDLMDLTR
jgi:2-methylcitrate dehydratase PrpD